MDDLISPCIMSVAWFMHEWWVPFGVSKPDEQQS